jgi:hypothetical protein
MRAKLQLLRFVLPSLGILLLVACDGRTIRYQGNCGQQSQQFMDYIYGLVVEELNPAIDDGLNSGSNADVIERIEELDIRISQLNTPACNPKTQAARDALRLYLLETKNYFSTVAGRAVYGEGAVQGQQSKMYEAFLAFEIAFEDVRR